MNRDLHNNIKVVHAIDPQAVGTSGSGGGKTSAAIDRTGYRSVEFIFSAGAAASANDTITPVVLEGDATNGSFTSVADADLLGTEAAISRVATGKVGYRGVKRYVKLQVYGTGTATCIVSAAALLGNPEQRPVA